jgi:hypothetical protein
MKQGTKERMKKRTKKERTKEIHPFIHPEVEEAVIFFIGTTSPTQFMVVVELIPH